MFFKIVKDKYLYMTEGERDGRNVKHNVLFKFKIDDLLKLKSFRKVIGLYFYNFESRQERVFNYFLKQVIDVSGKTFQYDVRKVFRTLLNGLFDFFNKFRLESSDCVDFMISLGHLYGDWYYYKSLSGRGKRYCFIYNLSYKGIFKSYGGLEEKELDFKLAFFLGEKGLFGFKFIDKKISWKEKFDVVISNVEIENCEDIGELFIRFDYDFFDDESIRDKLQNNISSGMKMKKIIKLCRYFVEMKGVLFSWNWVLKLFLERYAKIGNEKLKQGFFMLFFIWFKIVFENEFEI
ncbi:MAG: hypothetical protein ACP5Q5_01785 [Brevinematia bacterium]